MNDSDIFILIFLLLIVGVFWVELREIVTFMYRILVGWVGVLVMLVIVMINMLIGKGR